MTSEVHEFFVSAKESEYLKQLARQDETLNSLLKFGEGPYGRVTIGLSRLEAEQLRGFLTTHLAAVGSDDHYFPNEQGKILESLIDKFFIP